MFAGKNPFSSKDKKIFYLLLNVRILIRFIEYNENPKSKPATGSDKIRYTGFFSFPPVKIKPRTIFAKACARFTTNKLKPK
jgi:hypothetical protein